MERETIRGEGMLESFAHVGWGAILISTEGRVLALNCEAQRHLGHSFVFVPGQIAAMHRNANGELQRVIANAFLAQNGSAIAAPREAVLLPRLEGRPLMAYAIPVRASRRQCARHATAVVVFIDPDKQHEPTESILRRMFGLTVAETQVALRLARGHDLQEIANDQGLGLGTIRNYLTRVFAKTSTRRQAELTMLLGLAYGRHVRQRLRAPRRQIIGPIARQAAGFVAKGIDRGYRMSYS